MRSCFQFSIIIAILVKIVCCQQWYMPDSHLISDTQFQRLVKDDKSTFKLVKYFSPNCVYCRYLKQVIDKLKLEKEWCFSMYDFNCAWYPQHCMKNVKSGSFPYTAIHNGQGQLHQQIHGFYPEPVIRTIFNRIQDLCLLIKNPPKQSLQNPPLEKISNLKVSNDIQKENPKQNIQNIIKADQQVKKNVQQKIVEKEQQMQQAVSEIIEPQNKFDQAKVVLQEQQVKLNQISQQIGEKSNPQSNQQHSSKIEGNDYAKYLIYGATILISAYYFHHINKGKQVLSQNHQFHQQHHPLIERNHQQPQSQTHLQSIIRVQSQLLTQIPDEQL